MTQSFSRSHAVYFHSIADNMTVKYLHWIQVHLLYVIMEYNVDTATSALLCKHVEALRWLGACLIWNEI